jgi:flagellin
MSSIINSNINSLTAQTNLSRSQSSLSTSIARLSSGLRINSSADDAAGYAIVQGFTAQINGTNQAIRNASDGVSLAQTAGGALNQVTADLQRIRQLAVQSSNATNSAGDRTALQQEVSQLTGDIGAIGNTTQFNGLNLLDGSYTGQSFQVGANVGNTISVSVADTRSQSLGAATQESASGADAAAVTAQLGAGFKINGTVVSTTGATNLTDVISKVNAVSSTTGVTASRALSNVNSFTYAAPTAAQSLNINGVNINVGASATAAQTAAAINAVSAQTGVSASSTGVANLTLSSANAGDATVSQSAATILTAVNGTTAVVGATGSGTTFEAGIVFSSNIGSTPTIAENTGTLGAALSVLTGGAAGSTKAATGNYQVSTLDVSTSATAQNAIKTIDFALQQVAGISAQLGAIQNRFTATISNLQTTSTNLSSSRSSIQDTDFAAETANLTRTQVLQQAGTAVLAQANQIPNQVLALLR